MVKGLVADPKTFGSAFFLPAQNHNQEGIMRKLVLLLLIVIFLLAIRAY